MTDKMLVRVQSPEHGTKRIETRPGERTSDFLEKVQKEFSLSDIGWAVYLNRDQANKIVNSRSKTLSSYRIKHGDMLFLQSTNNTSKSANAHSQAGVFKPANSQSTTSTTPFSAKARNHKITENHIKEDEVDKLLEKQDGRIHRGKNEQLCRHGASGKCFHCVPLEPFDESYLKSQDPPIKFLSFHSYIRKLTSGVDKGKFVNLENLSCKIKPGCSEHPPWPNGICTKCQPNAVTLNRQKYRHIDYVQFENAFLMDRFLNYWRSTGDQRIGIMYGKYEQYDKVPLGIKTVVAAIYEPPQISTRNSVELLDDAQQSLVNQLAGHLGLFPVGWIFTDLIAKDLQEGTVKHFRQNIDSHFLSAEECIMAAEFQCKYPNPCRMSSDGHFGSKFATVVVTGDSQHQIHFEGYQVSDQCMALVKDECLIPTLDAPELAYVKESSNEQYVPDVFYKEKDVYGNEVTRIARPLPVEYLLIDSPAAFPVEQQKTFSVHSQKPFPIETRSSMGQIQDFNAFCNYMQQFPESDFLEAVSDFHLLLFLATCDMLPLRDHLHGLLTAVKDKDVVAAEQWRHSEQWMTVEQLMQAHMPSPPASRQESMESGAAYVGRHASPLPPIGAQGGGATWACVHCTYVNQSGTGNCEMCGLPPS